MTTDLTVIQPVTNIEVAESWASLSKDARKRKAAAASIENNRNNLRSLMIAYVLMWGRSGPETSNQTLATYWRGAKKLLDWCLVNTILPHQIESLHARRFVSSLNKLSPKSQLTYLSGAKSMIAALRWAGLGSGDPFENIRIRDNQAVANKPDPYTNEELLALFQIADKRQLALILLGADAGLRLAETTNLRWQNIDFERGYIQIRGKGGKIAKITATNRLLAALKNLDKSPTGKVFSISRRRIQQVFDQVCIRAEIKSRGYHNLRHSCGTRLYRISKDLTLVARHLRHSSTKTSEIYVTLADTDFESAILELEKNGMADD